MINLELNTAGEAATRLRSLWVCECADLWAGEPLYGQLGMRGIASGDSLLFNLNQSNDRGGGCILGLPCFS